LKRRTHAKTEVLLQMCKMAVVQSGVEQHPAKIQSDGEGGSR
jgi:hypothetical protein